MSGIPSSYRTPHGLTDDLRQKVLRVARGTLGTIQPDGTPHLTLVLFDLVDDHVVIPTPGSTRKIKNIRARPHASMLFIVERGWVSCTGSAEVVEGDGAAALATRVRERLLTHQGMEAIGRYLEAHEDSVIRIAPQKWLSWSSGEMVEWIAGTGVDLDENPPSSWWRDLGG